jgi:hypothetical protein
MKWQHWTGGAIIVLIFLIYPSCKEQDMVFTWVKPESEGISENAKWIFGRYSSGRIVQARECREIAEGWDALNAFWLLSFGVVLLSAYIGTTGGYYIRGNDNANKHKCELSELETKYKDRIEKADKIKSLPLFPYLRNPFVGQFSLTILPIRRIISRAITKKPSPGKIPARTASLNESVVLFVHPLNALYNYPYPLILSRESSESD